MPITGSLQQKNGMYYSVVNLYDESGKRKPKWISTKLPAVPGNKRKAEAVLHSELERLNSAEVPYTALTVAEYFRGWLDEIQPNVKHSTYFSYRGNMMNHIIPYFERKHILLQDLKPLDLETYYHQMMQTGSNLLSGAALSTTSIKHHHQNISKALSDAVRKGYLTVNPASAARTPRMKRYRAKFLNREELNALRLLFMGSKIETPVFLTSYYGFRRGEVLGLTWDSIDFVRKTITISQTLLERNGEVYTDSPKTESSDRTLPMNEMISEYLRSVKTRQNELRVLLGSFYANNNYVCVLENGDPITPNYLSKVFHTTLAKSTIPSIRFHDLRHSVATNLLDQGHSIAAVKDWLGHSSATTTLSFYAHSSATSLQEIASSLEADTLRREHFSTL